MTPLYIFDLDGTLALIEHRQHILECTDRDKWRRFYAACDLDTANLPVISTLELLRKTGAEVWIFTGRSGEVRDKTVAWLAAHTSLTNQELDGPALNMRTESNYTPDDVLKKQWLDSMLEVDRQRLVAVFEDRDRVVAMWRAAGVPCFQVAPGEF